MKTALYSVLLVAGLSLVSRVSGVEVAPVEVRPAQIPDKQFNVRDHGAKGDGHADDTYAIQAAFKACAEAGGGRVVVPPGVFLSGPLKFESGATALVLQKGGTLKVTNDPHAFGLPKPLPTTQAEMDKAVGKSVLPSFLTISDFKEVAILGEGLIDGNGQWWWDRSDVWVKRGKAPKEAGNVWIPRPRLISINRCDHVHLQGVTIRNAPNFNVFAKWCTNLLAEHLTIQAPGHSPNTDGIDPANCRNVLIRHCTIDTGDDNIAIKSGGGGRGSKSEPPSENITITDCKFLEGHGVSVGSETSAGLKNLLVQRCSFEGTDNGIRIKSTRGSGGPVDGVLCRDLTMKNVAKAFNLDLLYGEKGKAKESVAPAPVTETTPSIKHVRFVNITCIGATKTAGEIFGLPESPITDVTFENVQIRGAASPAKTQFTERIQLQNSEIPGLK